MYIPSKIQSTARFFLDKLLPGFGILIQNSQVLAVDDVLDSVSPFGDAAATVSCFLLDSALLSSLAGNTSSPSGVTIFKGALFYRILFFGFMNKKNKKKHSR